MLRKARVALTLLAVARLVYRRL